MFESKCWSNLKLTVVWWRTKIPLVIKAPYNALITIECTVCFNMIPCNQCFRLENLLFAQFARIVYTRAAQPVACGPHLSSEAVLCGPQSLFARSISSWKDLLSIFRQIKRSKPKPSSVWFSRKQFGFAAKSFIFLVFSCFLGQIPVILTEISTDLR